MKCWGQVSIWVTYFELIYYTVAVPLWFCSCKGEANICIAATYSSSVCVYTHSLRTNCPVKLHFLKCIHRFWSIFNVLHDYSNNAKANEMEICVRLVFLCLSTWKKSDTLNSRCSWSHTTPFQTLAVHQKRVITFINTHRCRLRLVSQTSSHRDTDVCSCGMTPETCTQCAWLTDLSCSLYSTIHLIHLIFQVELSMV